MTGEHELASPQSFGTLDLADPASKDLLLNQLGQLFDSPLYEASQVTLTLLRFRSLSLKAGILLGPTRRECRRSKRLEWQLVCSLQAHWSSMNGALDPRDQSM